MGTRREIVPALKYRWLTGLYDPLVRLTIREDEIKGALINDAGIKDGFTVLDVGCGTGTLILKMNSRRPDLTAIGLDADEEILHIAKRKSLADGLSIRVAGGLSDNLPFPDRSFDRVFSSLFFHHITRKERLDTFREIFRVLKPVGELHYADFGQPAGPLQSAISILIKFGDGISRTRDNFEGKLPEQLEECGFENVSQLGMIRTILGTVRQIRAVKKA